LRFFLLTLDDLYVIGNTRISIIVIWLMAGIWRILIPAILPLAGIWRKIDQMKYPYFEKYKIPYEITITDKLVELLMVIAEQRPFLEESVNSKLEIQLLRKAKVRAITYSNQIEGNDLKEEQVTALIAGKKVKGQEKDIAEIQNYHEALDYVETLSRESGKLKLRDICDIQKLITNGQLPTKLSGSLRTGPVSIINSVTQEVIEECPPHYDLPYLMEELVQWLEDNKARNSFVLAFAAHFITVAIHPFTDGNGRTVRLLQHYLLLKKNEMMAQFIPSETSIMANRERYYLSIRQSRQLNRLDPIVEFLAECFADSAQSVVKEARIMLKDLAGKSPQARQEKIAKFIKTRSGVSSSDIVTHFSDVPRRTIERDLTELLRSKKIKATGSTRARRYS
jgi:Fic family protein